MLPHLEVSSAPRQEFGSGGAAKSRVAELLVGWTRGRWSLLLWRPDGRQKEFWNILGVHKKVHSLRNVFSPFDGWTRQKYPGEGVADYTTRSKAYFAIVSNEKCLNCKACWRRGMFWINGCTRIVYRLEVHIQNLFSPKLHPIDQGCLKG